MRSVAGTERLRVVLDTNVLVSAIGIGGRVGRIESLMVKGTCQFFTSEFILGEFVRVMVQKINIKPGTVAVAAAKIRAHSTVVMPGERIQMIKADETDNRILECAVAAEAQVIVTGNMKQIRPVGVFRGIRILTPNEFLVEYDKEKNR